MCIRDSNGAGKSSTLRAIGGVNAHSSGRLTVAGFDMGTPDGADAARALVGYCPDIGGLIAQATPEEHVDLVASLRGTRGCLLYTSPSPRDRTRSRMPSS